MDREYRSLTEALEAVYGAGTGVTEKRRVSGGDINEAFRLTLTNGERVFMKANAPDRLGMFRCERDGLAAIAGTRTIGTPRVLAAGKDDGLGRSFLLMEFLDEGRQAPGFWETFAAELAAMHRADAGALVPGGNFGFYQDNVVGSGLQKNTPAERWSDFFRDCRLAPQVKRAEHYLDAGTRNALDRILGRMDELLPEPERPSLLHGDLWGGNFVCGPDGKAWIIDPAVYVGHAEADIAMTELFGGFSPRFYAAYRESGLLQPGYDRRRDLYNLYHLLNHLNLFGTAYLSSVVRVVRAYS